MAEAAKAANRMTWREWQESRGAKRRMLEAKGLGAPCRRTTARPEALAAAMAFAVRGAERQAEAGL